MLAKDRPDIELLRKLMLALNATIIAKAATPIIEINLFFIFLILNFNIQKHLMNVVKIQQFF
jgi:hypothetical protein